MPNLLSGLSFGAPWILVALAALPAIWFLLRVPPPMARRVVFPPVRLLLGLRNSEETPARTPMWLLLLRTLAAAFVIAALAQPILGAAQEPAAKGPTVLLVDNGWTAAPNWSARLTAISDALNIAERSGRPLAIVTTADPGNSGISLLNAATAERAMRAITPVSWLPGRLAAANQIQKTRFRLRPDILWLSDGIDDDRARQVTRILSQTGNLRVFADGATHAPLALLPPVNEPNGFTVTVVRPVATGAREGDVAALGERGESLTTAHFRFDDGRTRTTTKLVLPLDVRNETARIALLNQESSGAVQLM